MNLMVLFFILIVFIMSYLGKRFIKNIDVKVLISIFNGIILGSIIFYYYSQYRSIEHIFFTNLYTGQTEISLSNLLFNGSIIISLVWLLSTLIFKIISKSNNKYDCRSNSYE